VVTPEQHDGVVRRIKTGASITAAILAAGLEEHEARADAELMKAVCRAATIAKGELELAIIKSGDAHVRERLYQERAKELEYYSKFCEHAAGSDEAKAEWQALLDKFDDFELRCVETLLRGDVEEFQRLVRDEVVGRAHEMARVMVAERERKEPKPRPIEELIELDPATPLARGRSVVPFQQQNWSVR
jgi:hypothetical protein